jgi:ATP-dependent RNA helicase DDX5/DBP2
MARGAWRGVRAFCSPRLPSDKSAKVIIFSDTKRLCDEITSNLRREGFAALSIHGDKQQRERDWVLAEFRAGRTQIMVATDVASRGLDIKEVTMVINYAMPKGIEDYVHRIGRTGRAGETGVSVSFFTQEDGKLARDLIKILEEAKQEVPPQLAQMSQFSGYSGGGGGGRGYGGGGGGGGGGRGVEASSRMTAVAAAAACTEAHHHTRRVGF